MGYSQDLKKRVLLHIKKGSGKTEAAALFSVGSGTIYKCYLNLMIIISKASHMKTGGGVT
jgi:hypothetical protein